MDATLVGGARSLELLLLCRLPVYLAPIPDVNNISTLQLDMHDSPKSEVARLQSEG